MSWNNIFKKRLPVEGGVLQIHKAGPASQCLATRLLVDAGRSVVVLLEKAASLPLYHALMELFFGTDDRSQSGLVVDFPAYSPDRNDRQAWAARWKALSALGSRQGARVVLLPVENLFPRWPEPEVLSVFSLEVDRGGEVDPEELLETLTDWGYERVSMVSRTGETALRGGVLDIFTPGYEHPVRIEFFGNEIEGIRVFEPLSQRSKLELDRAVILPVTPNPGGLGAGARRLWANLKRSGDLSPKALADLENRLLRARETIPPGLYHERTAGLDRWLDPDATFILAETEGLRSRLEEQELAWRQTARDQGWPERSVVMTMGEVRGTWTGRSQLVFESLVMGREQAGLALPEQEINGFADLFWKPEAKARPWRTLVDALSAWGKEANQTVIAFRSEQSRKKFLHLAEQEDLHFRLRYSPSDRGLFALISPLSRGFRLEWNQVRVLSEDVIQPQIDKASAPPKGFKGLERHHELEPGELLVHRDYGLGRFEGLVRLQTGQAANDYLLLQYAQDDRLYLPVDRMGLVQRYQGPDGFPVSLDRLGGTGWVRSRDKARKAIELIARDLVEMYAYRKVAKGYTYSALGETYREFEAGFGFDETPDQEAAIRDVLHDMDRLEPMDRLICGDVGFGKTEVALRATFRAVSDGKQVALLCPTTVLAEQHYQNFRQRLDGFSVRVAMLSRFVPAARQKLIVQSAGRGEVDVLIGTHRLLSKDVKLPNLGLLVLDEEQRFGVKHKELIKKLKKQVDVLTLTATPIPRTLQLSLSGIRGLSVIETPPRDRKPVETALIEREPDLLREALARELARNGQVFWVYNRVEGLEERAIFVSSLAPQARVGMAHGRMASQALEETMHRFWHGELDILVCTAIIESGLDFPRANTLVVDQAQMFGLGQLYQLRGRVGRSREQAYAYFVIPGLKELGENARKRMQVILDMDYLGAGFQVAMEDLRIRGAGNILGEVQSGHIGKIGLDMFLEMLEEEIRRQRGEPVIQEVEPELSIGFSAHLPESYVPDGAERLLVYRRLTTCRTRRDLEAVREEMQDRFGHLPETFEAFIQVLDVKLRLKTLKVSKADIQAKSMVLAWPEDVGFIDPVAVLGWISSRAPKARLLPPAKLELPMPENASIVQSLRSSGALLDDLIEVLGLG
ncbi:MAG: transcription-repair coupling factor [Deltaproteobacteria bacterium]|nr:transcription-repair coupling factor [Deltaproteobacteria bacterium]